jgi:hypothetical protein
MDAAAFASQLREASTTSPKASRPTPATSMTSPEPG